MHCPICGQQQATPHIRYCSRCGFLLTGVAAVVGNNGELPGGSAERKDSPRKRGIKQGAFIFLLTFIVVPLLGMFHVATNTEPVLAGMGAVLLIFGGLLRIVYALMFESGAPGLPTAEERLVSASQQSFSKEKGREALPAGQSIPASVYAPPGTGAWRDTNDLVPPGSVTDSTTKLLQKNADDQ